MPPLLMERMPRWLVGVYMIIMIIMVMEVSLHPRILLSPRRLMLLCLHLVTASDPVLFQVSSAPERRSLKITQIILWVARELVLVTTVDP